MIHNKHNAEWESPTPINTLSVGLLDDLCRRLTPSYTVVYSRPSLGLAGYAYDHTTMNGASTRQPSAARFSCRTVFVLVRNRVTAYDLSGNGCG